MESYNVTMIMLWVCFGLVTLIFLFRPIKFCFILLFKTLMGSGIIYFVNFAFVHMNFRGMVGLNPITGIVSGILGLPGIISMYILKTII